MITLSIFLVLLLVLSYFLLLVLLAEYWWSKQMDFMDNNIPSWIFFVSLIVIDIGSFLDFGFYKSIIPLLSSESIKSINEQALNSTALYILLSPFVVITLSAIFNAIWINREEKNSKKKSFYDNCRAFGKEKAALISLGQVYDKYNHIQIMSSNEAKKEVEKKWPNLHPIIQKLYVVVKETN